MNSISLTPLGLKKSKKIWTDEEDKILLCIVKENPNLNWNEISKKFREHCTSHKTGKQCRERFRNYADPNLNKFDWKAAEKVLFIVLQRIFNNQWCNISRYIVHRSDIAVKNYYYSTVRKVLKTLKAEEVPSKPEEFYQAYYTLELLLKEYLPMMNMSEDLSKPTHKGKIILKLLKERCVTKEEVISYLTLLINKFKEEHALDSLPIKIVINLNEHDLPDESVLELMSKESLCNTPPLNQLILIKLVPKISKPETGTLSPHTMPSASTGMQAGSMFLNLHLNLSYNPVWEQRCVLPMPSCLPHPYYMPFQKFVMPAPELEPPRKSLGEF